MSTRALEARRGGWAVVTVVMVVTGWVGVVQREAKP